MSSWVTVPVSVEEASLGGDDAITLDSAKSEFFIVPTQVSVSTLDSKIAHNAIR